LQRCPQELRSSPAVNRVPCLANASAWARATHFVAQQKGRRRDACGLPGEKLFEIPNSHPLPPDARAASRGREALWSQKRGFAERNSARVARGTHVPVPRDPGAGALCAILDSSDGTKSAVPA
jgi:hypothetical protein